jgi:hypothetical protein
MMTNEERLALAKELMSVVGKHLGQHLLTSTGPEYRQRMTEMSTLQARVSAIVMHDGPADTGLLFTIKTLETECARIAASVSRPVWGRQ